jgi:hypothetical protein
MIYLRQALNALPYYFLEDLIQELLGKISVPNRAAQVRLLAETLERRETLRSLWERLRHEEQEAVRLSLYNDGKLDLITYEALYGEPPEKGFSGLYGYRRKPQYLKLFFLSGWELPIEMIEPLKEWVDPPPPFQPRGLADLPAHVPGLRGEMALSVVETEQAVWHDFAALLRLAQKGALKISETTHMPSAAAVRAMQKELLVLDYYDVGDLARAADTIRPVGLTFALQAGGLAKVDGGALVPTRVGLEWLNDPTAAGLRDAFDGWVSSNSLDEIRRIGSLRGFQSNAAEFTNPVSRRRAILSAFKHYRPGEWIQVEEFFKTIKLCGHNFLVEAKNITAIQVQGYGLLDNATYHTYWRAVNGQYVLVLLMEYLASFGAIDFACTDPQLAQYDLGGLGEYVQHPFSRYDGLLYFRLTPLGLYLIGQSEVYAPAESMDLQQSGLDFAGGLLVRLRRPETLNPNDRAMLEKFAERVNEEVYRLDGRRTIESSEQGLKLGEALLFLQRKAGQEAPHEVHDFFERLKKRSQVVARKNDAVLYQVKDIELMKSLLKDDVLGELCVLAEDHQLVVPVKHEAAFRRRLHELEAGVKS